MNAHNSVKFETLDGGEYINVFIADTDSPFFTINKKEREWGCAPEDNWPTWETLCERAGYDPNGDEIITALNKAAGFE
jgi:hypothetical protein